MKKVVLLSVFQYVIRFSFQVLMVVGENERIKGFGIGTKLNLLNLLYKKCNGNTINVRKCI